VNKRRITAEITAVGGYVPEDRLTNKDLEEMVETSDEWITERTGIKERRILRDPSMATSDMAVFAVKKLLDDAGLLPEEIDCLVLATSTPDQLLAPAASLVCDKAGLVNAWGFDLNAACSGFLYALSMGASLIESERYKKVIVIGADQMSAIVNYTDRNTCILFGDGAGAVLLEPSTTGAGVVDYIFKTDGKGVACLSVPAGGSREPASAETLAAGHNYVQQDGKTVFKAAIKGMSDACTEIMERNDLISDDVNWVIPHQANLRIISAVGKRLNFAPEKVKVNIQRYGNTTAATIPLCLWDFQDDFSPGDNVLLTAFGAGFTWGGTYLKWGTLRRNNK
jgi:3-oxoacyl-[acyl-carrier-protein] synthase-3